MYICKYFKIIKLHFYFNSQLFLIILKRFEFNDIKLALARIDVADDLPQLPESHILLLRMLSVSVSSVTVEVAVTAMVQK